MAKKNRVSARAQKAAQKAAYVKAVKKATPFVMPKTDKHIVVSLGYNSAFAGRLSRQFSPADAWHEIRVDTHEQPEPDIQSRLWNIAQIPDASVDGVWIGYILQRFTFEEVRSILRESLRIMKEGAQIFVAVPDLQTASIYVARSEHEHEMYHSPAGAVSPIDMMFGFTKLVDGGDHSYVHKSGYTIDMLSEIMRTEGICNMHVKRNEFDLLALGKKLPYGHPERVDRVVSVQKGVERAKAPDAPKAKENADRPVRYADVLDVEPQIWKPLGLKKAKK